MGQGLSSFEPVPDWRESRGLAALSSAASRAIFELAAPSHLTVRVESEPIPILASILSVLSALQAMRLAVGSSVPSKYQTVEGRAATTDFLNPALNHLMYCTDIDEIARMAARWRALSGVVR